MKTVVDRLAALGSSVWRIVITGHADRIGNRLANQKISESRANGVKSFFVQSGLDIDAIKAIGVGADYPIRKCPGKRITKRAIQCLKANRRIEVEVFGTS